MPRTPNPDAEKKAPLAARVDPRIVVWLESIARTEERTVSKVVERILRAEMERATAKRKG